jgi:hypothetical protein
MCVCDRHESFRAEEFADRELFGEHLGEKRAPRAVSSSLLLVG